MNANQTQKNARIALIRDRVEARAEYASDFEIIPVACLEPGTFILSMVEETLASLDAQEEIQLTGFAAQLDRISAQYDIAEGFQSLDVSEFIDSSFELMGVSK